MLMASLLVRNWCERPRIPCLFSATKI